MRRLTRPERDDQGVATILLVCVMAALLSAAGLAIDVGHNVFEARVAQNSADATVLAVATDCALTGSPIVDYATYRRTGQTINTPTCVSDEPNTTKITVTKAVSGFFSADHSLNRQAAATWGTLGTATTLPIVIPDCEFPDLQTLDDTTNLTLLLDNPQPQSGCSSLPGGFSQLASNNCEVIVSASGTADGKPGNDLQKLNGCILPIPRDILVPLYDAVACDATDCKGVGPYPILGFAMFRLTGYWFTNNQNSGGTLRNAGCPAPESSPTSLPGNGNGPKNCIRGDFIRFVTSQGTPGPSTDFGAYNVYLSK